MIRMGHSIGLFAITFSIVSLILFTSFESVFAASSVVNAESIGFEETTIIEFENTGKTPIEMIRIWLGSDFNFKSFKTEEGWTGVKTPQGVIVFTTTQPLNPGDAVKFGVKTDKPKPGINWKVLDKNENELDIGKTLVTLSPTKPIKAPGQTIPTGDTGILEASSFRLIPDKPNVGSTIRVTGDNFVVNQKFDFFIGDTKLTSFETDGSGHFIFTTKVPDNQNPDRVNFVVKDKEGNEKTVSLRLGEIQKRMAAGEVKLTLSNLKPVYHRGDVVLLSGTGNPDATITAKIKAPDGNIITTETTNVNPQGKWTYEAIVRIDAPFGEYSAEITDGINKISRSWLIESGKMLQITPLQLKFEPGETIVFNGTAAPNQDIEIVLEDPLGSEVYNDIITPDASGRVEINFKTLISDLEGTYVLIAFQGKESQIVPVGLGELPEIQLVAKMDKLNYKPSEIGTLAIEGPSSATLSLLIIDPSDKTKFSDTIILGPDGKKDYQLDLAGYASGVYTAVLTRGNSQTEEVFTVGLQTGSGPIEVRTTKETYRPGEPILILGNSASNILLTVTLIDPDGNEVRVKETFTNKQGVLSEGSFRIPSNPKIGVWKINAKSGPNFDIVEFNVVPSLDEGMSVFVTSIETIPGVGKVVNIKITGAAQTQTVVIEIISPENEVVQKLSFPSTENGEVITPWPIPTGSIPGTYTIKAKDPSNSAETTFVIE